MNGIAALLDRLGRAVMENVKETPGSNRRRSRQPTGETGIMGIKSP